MHQKRKKEKKKQVEEGKSKWVYGPQHQLHPQCPYIESLEMSHARAPSPLGCRLPLRLLPQRVERQHGGEQPLPQAAALLARLLPALPDESTEGGKHRRCIVVVLRHQKG